MWGCSFVDSNVFSPVVLCILCVKAALTKPNSAKDPGREQCRVPVNHPVRFSGNKPNCFTVKHGTAFHRSSVISSTCPFSSLHVFWSVNFHIFVRTKPSLRSIIRLKRLVWQKKETNVTEWPAKLSKTASFKFRDLHVTYWRLCIGDGEENEFAFLAAKPKTLTVTSRPLAADWASRKDRAIREASSFLHFQCLIDCCLFHSNWVVFYWNQLNAL